MTLKVAVQKLYRDGCSMIPSGGGENGKSPQVRWREYQNRQVHSRTLNQWLKRWSGLWGMVTGEISDRVVIDVDRGADLSIMDGLEPHVETPGGGCHYYFSYPAHRVKTCAGILPNIDIRGDGGFVNVLGRNPITGGRYSVRVLPTLETLHPWERMPRAILDILNQARASADEATPTMSKDIIPEGERNSMLTSLAGSMRYRGMTAEAIESALLVENKERCQPPLDAEEVRAIAKSVAQYESAQSNKRPRMSTQLLEIVKDTGIELFHGPDHVPYMVVKKEKHSEVWPLESRDAKVYLARHFYEETGAAPGSETMQSVLNVLRGQALFDEGEEPVYVRLARHDGKVYVDIGDSDWNVIEITTEDWQTIESPPIRFVRKGGMISLPAPQRNGDIHELKKCINVTEDDWPLVLGWLLGTFMAKGPFPVLVITGEQGSAKSTVAKMLRLLVDPSSIPLRSLPGEERDLSISANNTWILAFDNVSYIRPWLSDAFCRLATGGGFATRELYANSDEVLFTATRPIILNGIGDIATRSDLLDRTIFLTLPVIPSDKRRTEEELWEEFESMRPKILGLLLDAVSLALRDVDNICIEDMPRMADFVKWVFAGIPALGVDPTDFLEAYRWNIQDINELALESSPAVQALKTLAADLSEGGYWEGTATQLLEELSLHTVDEVLRRKEWPKNPRALSVVLTRLAPNLRSIGIDITRGRGTGERLIRIGKGKQGYRTPTKKKKACIVTELPTGGYRIQLNTRGIPGTES